MSALAKRHFGLRVDTTTAAVADHSQVPFATVQLTRSGCDERGRLPLRRLRRGVELHVTADGRIASSVAGLPPVLKRGCYSINARQCHATEGNEQSEQLLITANVPTRLYLLWPALQYLPSWLQQEFELVKGAEVKVHWSDFTRQQRFYLNVTNQRKLYQEQVLLVFRPKGNHGFLMPGDEIELPYIACRKSSGAEQPFFSHVICLRPAKKFSASGAGGAASQAGALLAAQSFSACSLPEISAALEDGYLNPAELRENAAGDLLQRSVAAGNEELLYMLLESGIGPCSPQESLQAVLEYAWLEDMPQLAEVVIEHSAAEFTQPVLDWLVRYLVRNKNINEVEAMLAGYCLDRRNPLSSIAAVEQAASSAAQLHSMVNADALQLVRKFRAAKLSLLQQLVVQYGVDATSITHVQFPGGDIPSGHKYLLQELKGNSPVDTPGILKLRPLQQVVRRCMQMTSADSYGTRSSKAVSIHDVSPYSIAITLEDTDFLQHPAVLEYTRRLWRGLELHKMAQAWQRAAATAVPEGATGSSDEWVVAPRRASILLPRPRLGVGRTASQLLGPHGILKPTAPTSTNTQRRSMDNLSSTNSNRMATVSFAVPTGLPSLPAVEGTTVPSSMPSATPTKSDAALRLPSFSTTDSNTDTLHSSGVSGVPGKPGPDAQLWPTSSNPGPCAEGAEQCQDGAASNWSRLGATSRVAPEFMNTGGSNGAFVRRRSLQSSTEEAEQHDAGCDSSDNEANQSTAEFDAPRVSAAVWMNPDVGVEIMQNLGLTGSLAQPIARQATRWLHGLLMTPRALHDTAKYRWMLRCGVELYFLMMYLALSLGQSHMNILPANFVMLDLALMVLGNLVSMAMEIRWLHGNSLLNYIRDSWNKLDLIVNIGLLAVLVWSYLAYYAGYTFDGSAILQQYGVNMAYVIPAAFSVFVWTRALGVLSPGNERLGAMLYTLRKGAEEAAVMLPLVLVLIVGFSTMLWSVYHDVYPEYNSFLGAIRMFAVVSLGGDNAVLDFERENSGGNPFLVSWGQIVLLVYGVIFNILILSLLVAVITKTYNPESVRAKAVLMGAKAVRYYDWLICHDIAYSPANIFQLAVSWLPSGHRSRVPPAKYLKYLIPPLDGYVPDIIVSDPAMQLGTGPEEVSYLAFMLFLYPVVSLVAVALLLVHLPLGMLYTVFKGHVMWLDSTWNAGGSTRQAAEWNQAAEGEGGRHRWSADEGASGLEYSETPGPLMTPHYGRSMMASPRICEWDALQSPCGTVRQHQKITGTGWHMQTPRASCRAGGTWQDPAQQPNISSKIVMVMRQVYQALISEMREKAFAVCFAVLAHVILVLAVVLALLSAFMTRVVFSLYCILSPWAADSSSDNQPTRFADFWSKSSLYGALVAAQLNVSGIDPNASGTHPAQQPAVTAQDSNSNNIQTAAARRLSDGEVLCQLHYQQAQSGHDHQSAVSVDKDPHSSVPAGFETWCVRDNPAADIQVNSTMPAAAVATCPLAVSRLRLDI